MIDLIFTPDRKGFTKMSDGLRYEFDNEHEAKIGCGHCLIFENNNLIKDGYCLNGNFICPFDDDNEMLKQQDKIDEMFKQIGK